MRGEILKTDFKPVIYKGLPWLLLGSVLIPAAATAAVGILILALWEGAADIALGILTICFAVFMLGGAFTTFLLLFRQNKLTMLQSNFMANVSHELRTPLASIRMYTDTLVMGRAKTEEDRIQCLDALERETRRLSVLVERLLDFRRQSIVKGGENRECLAPEELMKSVIDAHASMGKQRLEFLVEPQLPLVHVNRDEAFDALSNIVKNALTHGGNGIVVVTVRSDAEGVAFHVRDTGPGISRKEQKDIFKRFHRLEEKNGRENVSGFGMGLAIAKGFAESNGGAVSVKSRIGRGSTFTLWLPAHDSPHNDFEEIKG